MKFLTWNIQGGGGTRIQKIVREISTHSPDFITLTEFRVGKESELRPQLQSAGYDYISTSIPADKENGILIASKQPFSISEEQNESDPQRWLLVNLNHSQISVLSVHIPGAPDHKFVNGVGISGQKRKEIFWDKLLDYAENNLSSKSIILGDFNTGLKIDAEGTPFKLSDKMRRLYDIGFIDTWRHLNPDTRGYTYYSQQKVEGTTRDHNGFRLDYLYVSPELKSRITNVRHIDEPRKNKVSDHSILLADIAV